MFGRRARATSLGGGTSWQPSGERRCLSSSSEGTGPGDPAGGAAGGEAFRVIAEAIADADWRDTAGRPGRDPSPAVQSDRTSCCRGFGHISSTPKRPHAETTVPRVRLAASAAAVHSPRQFPQEAPPAWRSPTCD